MTNLNPMPMPAVMKTRISLDAPRTRRPVAVPRTQRGLVVFVSLIVLVAMTLAGLAVMRSSGSAILSAGNLAFKQSTVVSGDAGIEQALSNYLRVVGPVTLENDAPASGYYATWLVAGSPPTEFDPITWTGWNDPSKRAAAGSDAAGNAVTYVIHRMCTATGPVDQDKCVVLAGDLKGGTKGGAAYGEKAIKGQSRPWYRITARIAGPKNTVSYVQSMVY